jgi:hypothetical protein
VITVPAGQSSTSVATVTLPKAFGTDVNRLAIACPTAKFVAGTCPASSRIGSAEATTPLLPVPAHQPGHARAATGERAAERVADAHRARDAAAARLDRLRRRD